MKYTYEKKYGLSFCSINNLQRNWANRSNCSKRDFALSLQRRNNNNGQKNANKKSVQGVDINGFI